MIACEALVVVCAPSHPLAGRRDVPLSALSNDAFVDFEPSWGTRQLVDRGFAEAGVERRTAFEVSDLDTLLDMVARGLGIALVPETIAEARRPSVGIIELAGPEMCWELVVAYAAAGKEQQGPADSLPRAFLELLIAQGNLGDANGHLQKPVRFKRVDNSLSRYRRRWVMTREAGLFDVEARLRELSAKGDDLERVNALVDFEAFRAELERAVPRADRAKGGRPPYDHVLMFRILILQASHSLSDERTEYLIKDRLSFMRFLGLSLADRVPDANSIWNFREALTRAQIGGVPAIEALFARFEAQLAARATSPWAGRSSTRPWWRRRSSATPRMRSAR